MSYSDDETIVCEFLRKISPSREWEYLGEIEHCWIGELCDAVRERESKENAKLWEQIERLQPKDCEGNALDIADTVHMLRSEYDGDHEWDDVVVELALTKWGGDRWIVRGSKGEAWACDCTKTGYDEDAFENSDDVEPFDDATLAEAENAKLRKLVRGLYKSFMHGNCYRWCGFEESCNHILDCKCQWYDRMCELGIEVDE